nr:MAG TPA: hypothetical protein [Caudoviricetes sp.]
MLNAKSVAIRVVSSLDPEWVEAFFLSPEALVDDLTEIIRNFRSVKEMRKAPDDDFLVREIDGQGYCSFRREILHVYGVK